MTNTTEGPSTTASPTADIMLTSREMAQFVSAGFLCYEGIVPEDLNQTAIALFESGVPPVPPGRPLSEVYDPDGPIGRLFALPRIRGSIKSLLGPEPVFDHHHVHERYAAEKSVQRLHSDAMLDLRRTRFDIQLMYYPGEVRPDMGGTLLIPGSHFRIVNELDIARYQNLHGQIRLTCPPGTVLILHHGLWHCGGRSTSDIVRYMLRVRLHPSGVQVRTWDTGDIDDPEIDEILARPFPWFEYADSRIELASRIRMWRALTGKHGYDIGMWLTRLETDRL